MRVRTLPLSATPPALDPLAALPAEWDAWAEEPAHQVLVEEAGAVVGALHVALVSATEAWLEGLRVRGDRQGGGVGRRLVMEGEALAKGYGARIARTAVPAHEYAAQAVAERAGFRPVARAVVHEVPIGDGPIDVPYDARVRGLKVSEAPAVTARLSAGDTLHAWQGLLPLGWRFRALLPEIVKGLIRDGRALQAGEAVEGVALYAIRSDAAVIFLLEGSPPQMDALVGTVAERGRGQGARRLVLFAPDDRALRAAGPGRRPHPWCPDGLVLVEKPL